MKRRGAPLALTLSVVAVKLLAQAPASMPPRPLPDAPFLLDSAEQPQIRVSVIKGLSHPWSLTFLPTGEMLVTERPGRLRIVRHGILDPARVGMTARPNPWWLRSRRVPRARAHPRAPRAG